MLGAISMNIVMLCAVFLHVGFHTCTDFVMNNLDIPKSVARLFSLTDSRDVKCAGSMHYNTD